jgi:uncharacterized membrane protein (DUF2068 family)
MGMPADRRQTLITRLIAIDPGRACAGVRGGRRGAGRAHDPPAPLSGVARELLPVARGTLATDLGPGRRLLIDALQQVVGLHRHTLVIVLLTAIGYAIVEAVEAVGLWRRRRWAEYLTVVATAGLLPFEFAELTRQVTPVRAGALVINVAVVAYLVWAKRLFGLRGGVTAQRATTGRSGSPDRIRHPRRPPQADPP